MNAADLTDMPTTEAMAVLMSAADEARAEAERRWPTAHTYITQAAVRAFRDGAEWQVSRPITDEMVEAAALALARFVSHDPHSVLIEGPNRDYYRAEARVALEAARGVQS